MGVKAIFIAVQSVRVAAVSEMGGYPAPGRNSSSSPFGSVFFLKERSATADVSSVDASDESLSASAERAGLHNEQVCGLLCVQYG